MKSLLILFGVFTFLILLVFNIPRIMYWRVGYFEKEGTIWYRDIHSWKWFTYSSKKIKEIDTHSFDKITKRYAKDKYRVYFEGSSVANADRETFEVLEENDAYSKDAQRVYYRGKMLSEDPNNFVTLQAGYAKDLKKVYRFGEDLKQRFHAPTFEFFGGDYKYPMDKNKITFEGKEIIGVDRSTFRLLEKGFSEDKNRKYRFSQVLVETN